MCTIRVFRGLANQVAPRAGSVLRGRLKVHNSKSGTCQGGVFLVYCMMYFMILIYFIILQLSRGASGKEFFGARTHGFCTHQARPTCKNTGKVNNRSRETGTHGRYCTNLVPYLNHLIYLNYLSNLVPYLTKPFSGFERRRNPLVALSADETL